jgi:hypothetical protein
LNTRRLIENASLAQRKIKMRDPFRIRSKSCLETDAVPFITALRKFILFCGVVTNDIDQASHAKAVFHLLNESPAIASKVELRMKTTIFNRINQQLKKKVELHSLEISDGKLTLNSLHRAFSLTQWLKLTGGTLYMSYELKNRPIPASIVRHLEFRDKYLSEVEMILNQQAVQPEILTLGELWQGTEDEIELMPGSLMKL